MRAIWVQTATGIALALFLLGPGLVQWGLLPPRLGFYLFLGALPFSLAAVGLGVWLAFKGAAATGIGLAVAGGIPLFVILISALQGGDVPVINDVSTDLEDPPAFLEAAKAKGNAGKDLTYPDRFKAEVRKGYPDLTPKRMPIPPEDAFKAVRDAAKDMEGFVIVREDFERLEIEGYQVSGIFRFVDDFVIRVRPGEESGSRVDMRSRSRVGKGDFGVNAKRIRAFFATF